MPALGTMLGRVTRLIAAADAARSLAFLYDVVGFGVVREADACACLRRNGLRLRIVFGSRSTGHAVARMLLRLASLSAAATIVAAGFCLPFLWPGGAGLASGALAILGSGIALWVAETKTRKALERDSLCSRLLRAHGSALIERADDR